MALSFPFNCPYCQTKQIGFTAQYDWRRQGQHTRHLLALCNACSEGVIFELSITQTSADYPLGKLTGDLISNGVGIKNHWPARVSDDVPEDIPEKVLSFYQQAVRCSRQEAWDAAGMTFRKTLEVSTKMLAPEFASVTLAKRIDALYEAQKLSLDVRDWAHEIRLDGNGAAHEDEPFTTEQAHDLQNFTHAYLKYVYSLPAMVQRSRAARGS